jgi:hypothetical protein
MLRVEFSRQGAVEHSSERVYEIREAPQSAQWWEAMFVEEGAGNEGFDRLITRDPQGC